MFARHRRYEDAVTWFNFEIYSFHLIVFFSNFFEKWDRNYRGNFFDLLEIWLHIFLLVLFSDLRRQSFWFCFHFYLGIVAEFRL